jgi:glycosyltransferase involved in cell wall biosynthesis
MKIILVTHTFLPKYLGGTEICTYELAKQYQQLGHKVVIFCSDPLSNNSSLEIIKSYYQGIEIYTIPKNILKYKKFLNTYLDKKPIEPFQLLIKNFKPDIVHYHHLMHLSLDLAKLVKTFKIPQILTLHDFWFQCLTHQRITTDGKLCSNFSIEKCSHCLSDIKNSGPMINTTFSLNNFLKNDNKLNYVKNISKKIFYRITGKTFYIFHKDKVIKIVKDRNKAIETLFSRLDLIIFPTKFLSNQFSKSIKNPQKTILSSDGINTEVFKKFKRLSSKSLRFGYIGSIIPTKGLDMILKAWPSLIKGNYNLKIYGNLETDKKYANNILHLAKNLKNIKFHGNFSPEKISEIYSEIDVLLVPSRWFENAPLVLRNATHTKTPVIAVSQGSIPELIIHNKNGLMYKNEDINGLIKQMNRFISDKKLISKMKNNYSHQKSIKENANELLTYYNQLIKK